MARVQYGTIITEIKGKVQGQVLQGGNVGFVLRNKGYTKGIASSERQVANTVLSANAARWRTLSDANRDAWAAITGDWIFYNKFGAAYEGSGYQVYNAYNGILTSNGISAATVPGSVASPINPGPQYWTLISGSNFEYERDVEGTSADQISFFATAPYSAGRNNNHLRYKKIYNTVATGITTVNLYTAYRTLFPQPIAGQKVSLRVKTWKTTFPYPLYDVILTAIMP
jgi:hypothetical protein